jgi:thiosulfate dehydrogenase (quinone) large subunit
MVLNKEEKIFGVLRISLGFIFIWAFFDKLLGLGFATTPERAWIAGGSPTTGFLSNAVTGPFEGLFKSLAGSTFVDILFMIGLLGIGISIMFGIAMKIGTVSGVLMMALMYIAQLPYPNNPVVNDYVIYSLLFMVMFYKSNSSELLGFGKSWKKLKLVKKYKFLE